AAFAIYARDRVFAAPGKSNAFRLQTDVDAFALQNLADGLRYIFVFALDQARAHLDDGHLTAEAAEHLSKLEADIAAAHDDQMPRKKVDLHHGAVGQILDLIESRHLRDQHAPAHVDEDALRGKPLRPHADLARRFKTSVAFVDRAVFQFLQPILQAGSRLS